MKEATSFFFNPRIGKNHHGRLILLATTGCCHGDCVHWNECTQGKQEDFADCKYPDFWESGKKVDLNDTVIYMVDKFINDRFDGETRYRTFTCLTNAISLAHSGEKLKRYEYDKVADIWDKFIITELCQHFIPCSEDKRYKDRNSVETKYSDFGKSSSFTKLLSLLKHLENIGITIRKIMILGVPSFKYIMNSCRDYHNIDFTSLQSSDGYWHELTINNKRIDILYTWHPSYGGYYDKDKEGKSILVKELKKFFECSND